MILRVVCVVFLLALLLPKCLYAADWSVRFGPSVQEGTTNGSAKIFGLRHEGYEFYGVSFAQEVGGYVDNGGRGRKGSALAKFQVGTTPGPETGLFGKAFFGPCYISTTDTQLGGHGQFCSDVGVGIRDRASFMAVNYSHISSAGLSMPNHGRDWLVFETGLRF
jgi:hypothetical protein